MQQIVSTKFFHSRCNETLARRKPLTSSCPFLQHDFPGSSQVVLLGMESASDKEVWQRAKSDGFVIVTRDADFQELSIVWGAPPQVIRLRTPNQSRSGVLKLLLDNKPTIESALEVEGKASIELIA